MERREQETVDSIMEGKEAGHYYLFLGPKVRFTLFKQKSVLFNNIFGGGTGLWENYDDDRRDAQSKCRWRRNV